MRKLVEITIVVILVLAIGAAVYAKIIKPDNGACEAVSPPGMTSVGTITFEVGGTSIQVKGGLSLDSEATQAHPHQWRVKSASGVDLTINPVPADSEQTAFKNNSKRVVVLSGGIPAAKAPCSLRLAGPNGQATFLRGGTLLVSI